MYISWKIAVQRHYLDPKHYICFFHSKKRAVQKSNSFPETSREQTRLEESRDRLILVLAILVRLNNYPVGLNQENKTNGKTAGQGVRGIILEECSSQKRI